MQVKRGLWMNSYILQRSLNADLKAMKDGYTAGSTGRLFQSLIVCGKNELAYTVVLLWGIANRELCPLVDVESWVR